jgi:uncharacterized protein YgiM (DUF1202 family)
LFFLGRTNRWESAILGKTAQQMVRVSLQNEGKEIDINIDASGNFSQGNQEAVTKMINDFKNGLARQFGGTEVANREINVTSTAGQQSEQSGKINSPVSSESFVVAVADQANNTPQAVVPAPSVSVEPSNTQSLVCIKQANVRAAANNKSKIIITLKKGEKVEHLGNSGNWCNIKLPSGLAGWIFKDYVKASN